MSPAQPEEYYKTSEEVSEALRVKDVVSLTKGLSKLRSQLTFAVKDRVDPTEKLTRPLVEYAQSCNDSDELNSLWDYQASANIQDLECMLPDIVGLFIKLCKTPVIRAFGTQIIERILSRQMKYIYRGISSVRIPQCQSTFRLLTAITSFNQAMTRELFSTFNFQTEGFLKASRYRQNKKNNSGPQKYVYDLRTNYIYFVLSFFQHGDAEIKKQVLGVKGFVHALIMHMYEDAYPLVELILKVIYENLILDTAVPRSIKSFFLSPYILEKISKLYTRYEPESISAEETAIPADVVHHFLISTCSVLGVGVCYHDNKWYPMQTTSLEEGKSSRIANNILSKFMITLKPADDIRQQELLLKILGSCPELVQMYWKNSSFTFEARVSSKWLANMTVLQKIVSLPVPPLSYGSTGLYSAEPPSAETVLENILPHAFNRSFSSKGLQHASPLVRYTTTIILSAVFQKYSQVSQSFERVISDLQSLENRDTTRPKSSENWKKCMQTVRDGLRRRTPEISVIVALFNQTVSSAKKEEEDDEETQRQLLQENFFRLIRYYQEFVPETLMESNIDPSRFIPTDILSVKPGILIQLLHLFLHMPNFDWTSRSSGTSTHINTLLTLYLQTPYRHIRELTGQLLHQTLSDSFMFSHDPEEIQFWLNALPQNHTDDTAMSETQQHVLQYFDTCISRFNKMQYKYTDQLVTLFETVNKENSIHVSEYQHPFSPLLLTLRENLDFIKGDKRPAVLYFTTLVPFLLSKQNVPYYLQHLCSTLQVGKCENPTNVKKWDQSQMICNAKICLGLENAQEDVLSHESSSSTFSAMLGEQVHDVSEAKKRFINMLEQLSVCELDDCLENAARVCYETLGWTLFEPLIEYICTRHPLAGSLFSYKSVQSINSFDSTEYKYTAQLLQHIPFVNLFHNTIISNKQYTNVFALSTVEYVLSNIKATQLPTAISRIFLQIYVAKKNWDSNALHYLFKVLRKITSRVEQMTDIQLKEKLLSSIVHHPTLQTLRSELVSSIAHVKNLKQNNPIISIATTFIDIFAEESYAQTILDCVVHVDFNTLYSHCKEVSLYEDLKKLLITLVYHICSHCSETIHIPGKAFETIADIWATEQNNELNPDVLLLLESTTTNGDIKDTTRRVAMIKLLDTFCQPIVKHILLGNPCKIDMNLLGSSCLSSAVDLPSLVLERLDGSLRLTTSMIELVQISNDMITEKDSQNAFHVQVIEYILKQLIKVMDVNTMCDDVLEENFFEKMCGYVKGAPLDWSLVDPETVRDIILTTLMDNISDAPAIQFVNALVGLVYSDWEKREPIETYLRRVLDHVDYSKLTAPDLTTLLTREEPTNGDQRTALIELVHTLNKIQPLVLANHHGLLDTLLTSYSATVSYTDKLILNILMSSEQHSEVSLLAKMTIWGPGSDKTRQTHLQTGTLLQTHAISSDTLSLIDPAIMKYTFTHFPDCSQPQSSYPTYDPCFFLPLFANLISSGIIDCRKFIDCNGLGLIMLAMSSTDDNVRRIAYQMMDQYYVLLEHAKFKEQSSIQFVLEAFKHSITGRSELNAPPRIPPCISVCIAHTISILLHPGHYMLPHITKWILQNSSYGFDYIPMFSNLFTSASPNNKKERLWLLRVLLSSLKTYEDYKIFSRQRIFDIIGTFYNSSVSDENSKRVIKEIMEQATAIPRVATSLIHHKGLLAWIYQAEAFGDPLFPKDKFLQLLGLSE